MQQTLDSTSEIVAQACSQVKQNSDRLLHLLTFVPDDKLTWSPSETSKSSIRLVAHCALTSKFFADLLTHNMPDPMPSPQECFGALHAEELNYTTRESVIALTNENTAELCKAIETITAENIGSMLNSPFGPMPLQFWLAMSSEHMVGHAGQIEYIQTIWGDLDNHMG